MGDLTNPRALYLKGALFVVLGVVSGTLLLLEVPSLKGAILLALTVWAFARAYYFAFYVVEHYIDDEFRYAGLVAFFRYALTRRKKRGNGST